MKISIITVIATVVISSFLGSQNLYASNMIAKVVSEGGFTATPEKTGLYIRDDGMVISMNQSYIATLSPSKIRAIIKVIHTLEEAPLKLENPDVPECMDAPATTYSVRTSSGQQIKVGSKMNCRKSFMSNGQGRILVEVLDALNILNYLE